MPPRPRLVMRLLVRRFIWRMLRRIVRPARLLLFLALGPQFIIPLLLRWLLLGFHDDNSFLRKQETRGPGGIAFIATAAEAEFVNRRNTSASLHDLPVMPAHETTALTKRPRLTELI